MGRFEAAVAWVFILLSLLAAVVALTLHRLVAQDTVHVVLYQADRRDVVCHLVGWVSGMTRLCMLEANARFPTQSMAAKATLW